MPAVATTNLLRFATAGSVDDGKSTLIGRLLHDAKGLFDDQRDAVAAASARRGRDELDLSLVTDGLRAEREQGITIDVAYRYFATPRRNFIIADTPGHARYTRNMVTGASTADLAVILVDATQGLSEQTHRHACVAATLGINHMVLAVNKMDLVGWDEAVFDGIARDFALVAGALGVADVTPIPIAALHGDNVVEPSTQMAWYAGPTLLEHLETVDVVVPADTLGARLPVQYVIRDGGARRYAGSVAAGAVSAGDEVVVLPSGERTTVTDVATFDGSLERAVAPTAVSVTLADDLDVGRGDLIAAVANPPEVVRELDATVCWLTGDGVQAGDRLLLQHTTRVTRAVVRAVVDRLDVVSLERAPAERLDVNDLGTIRLAVATPLAVDPYSRNRTTGGFLLIDEASNATVGAGMVV